MRYMALQESSERSRKEASFNTPDSTVVRLLEHKRRDCQRAFDTKEMQSAIGGTALRLHKHWFPKRHTPSRFLFARID
ncbi:hypothetical protein NPIL_30501 [Nephila pilipes]|uniref:Uncharacterized protein n=1 Tax=Nephila pilipes TaxID=299642 RepID=A0A8X6NQ58_NEPPI|nr:hypothetical protein NPIL_30501 [Nephila pilipes]